METILDTILHSKQAEIAQLKPHASQLLTKAKAQTPPRPFLARMQKDIDQNGFALICEFKRKSPSAGIINNQSDPAQTARAYESGGASAMSVLTDAAYFGGSEADLQAARAAASLPILRKDFLIDPLQVHEARAMGADAILIIMAAISDMCANELHACAVELGMAVLIEIHDETELARALELPSPLLGINNRNLKTFQTDLAISERLTPLIPQDRITISESGISHADQIARLQRLGVRGFLIGQSLMQTSTPDDLLQRLRLRPEA